MTGHCTEQDGLFRKDGGSTKATESDTDKQIQFMSNKRQKRKSGIRNVVTLLNRGGEK